MVGVREGSALVGGHRAAYTAAGERGTPVVLVHGGASDRRDWAATVGALAASHRVFALDLIGYGESADPEPVYTVRHLSEFLRGFLEAAGLQRASLVGHSLGALACLEVARLAPEAVDRLVLVAPMGFGKMSRVGRALVALAWLWTRATLRPLPYPALSIDMKGAATDAFRSVGAPTLVVWGRRDPYFPAANAGLVLEALPNAGLELFEDSGHAPHREEAERFNRTVLEFLASSR